MSTCDANDHIMVDKGLNAQDLFAPYDFTLNMPTFLKNGNHSRLKF